MLALTHVYEALIGEPPAEGSLAAQLAQQVTEAVIDSRQSRAGALFVALKGERTDGHLFVEDAFARGAIAAICGPQARAAGVAARYLTAETADYGDESQALPLIFEVPDTIAALQQVGRHWRSLMPVDIVAVTGSVGKTTTKETIANVLSRRYRTLRSGGNYNNEIGLPLNLLQLTPAHERAVLEMGMYDLGEIRQLASIARPRDRRGDEYRANASRAVGHDRADCPGESGARASAAPGRRRWVRDPEPG